MFNKTQILTRKEIGKISEAKLVVNAAFLSLLIALLVLSAELGYNSMKAERDKPDGGFALYSRIIYSWTRVKEKGEEERRKSERKRKRERGRFVQPKITWCVYKENNQEGKKIKTF